MTRKQNHKPDIHIQDTRHQRKLNAIKLNAERMKLVRLIYGASGRHDVGNTIWGLMKDSRILTDKVRLDLEKL